VWDEDDKDLAIEVAKQFVARLGEAAIPELYGLGEIAVGIGDENSAETWFEIARAAEVILSDGGFSE